MSGIIHPTTAANIGFGFGTAGNGYYPDRVWHGVFYESFHGGIDYWGPLGYPIWAAANGTVQYAGYAVPYIGVAGGNGVVIQHGSSMRTVYGHMDTVEVTPGMQVVAGQRIGTMGMSGIANGVIHLHFEVRTFTAEWGEDVENPFELMIGGALYASGFAMETQDIPWVEPPAGTAMQMALCVRQSDGSYALPTAASKLDAVYYDRLLVPPNGYTTRVSEGNIFIVPAVSINIEVEVRADYVT